MGTWTMALWEHPSATASAGGGIGRLAGGGLGPIWLPEEFPMTSSVRYWPAACCWPRYSPGPRAWPTPWRDGPAGPAVCGVVCLAGGGRGREVDGGPGGLAGNYQRYHRPLCRSHRRRRHSGAFIRPDPATPAACSSQPAPSGLQRLFVACAARPFAGRSRTGPAALGDGAGALRRIHFHRQLCRWWRDLAMAGLTRHAVCDHYRAAVGAWGSRKDRGRETGAGSRRWRRLCFFRSCCS